SIALQADGAWVTEFHKEQNAMTTAAFWHSNDYQNNFTYLIDGTPCELVINSNTVVHFAERIQELFPRDHKMLSKFKGESYTGTALHDERGAVLGSIAIINSKPMEITGEVREIFNMIKSRTASELQRLRREREILNRENHLRGLINGVKDLLINVNDKGQIVMLNSTAESTLGLDGNHCSGQHISRFLTESCRSKLISLIESINAKTGGERYLWIPGTLKIVSESGSAFDAEGTLSRYELDGKIYYTLVLRGRDESGEAAEKSKQLIDETEYLQEELEEMKSSSQLIGESNAVKRLLQNIYMVAYTDATVLLSGETGTGKELVARHIHQISSRKDKPMITVNCGAIPPALMESEFFGHARGAFTGATAERKGRFQLAHGGTLFLDEIGELPLDLQVKLLRVIQEGEFEPVGSSKTIKVNVRIIAATHRNLFELCKENKFREDLYYRLNVFPLDVPPLRERQNDVVLIAGTFIRNCEKRLGKRLKPLSEEQERLLRSYSWPGNVRELQNIIERASILSHEGVLDLQTTLGFAKVNNIPAIDADNDRILTRDEVVELEKLNIIKALKLCKGRVSGRDGAAALLHMVPSTLSSRIIALGINIPK
ncbi:MAG TPA: sigma 54-interacting transcriptional regulator, partial [Cyclobacteriaceae bacterium]